MHQTKLQKAKKCSWTKWMNMMRDSSHPIYSSSKVQKTTISICHFSTFDYFILYSMISLQCISRFPLVVSNLNSFWCGFRKSESVIWISIFCRIVNACVFTMCISVICFFIFRLFSLSVEIIIHYLYCKQRAKTFWFVFFSYMYSNNQQNEK